VRILICPITVHGAGFYAEMARSLMAAGHEVIAATIQRRIERDYRQQGIPVDYFPERMQRAMQDLRVDEKLCRRVERDNQLISLKDVYLADKVSANKPEERFVRRTVAHFLAWESFARDYPVDVAVPGVGTETIRMSAFYFHRARGVPVYLFFHTFLPNSLRIMVNGFLDPLVKPDELSPVGPEQRAAVQQLIDAHHAKATPMVPFRYPRLSWHKVKDYSAHLRDYLFLEDSWEKSYFSPMQVARNFLSKKATRLAARFVYQRPRPDERYVFFPLHVTRDFKIAVVTPHLVDQEAMIGQLSAALPQGHKLYLKEHPMGIGRTPARELRRLGRLDNVRVIKPEYNTHEMIKDAEAVVVISSTVGFDAMTYSKPVITFGRPYYRFEGLTFDVDDMQHLRGVVREALDYEPDPERLVQYLAVAMTKTHPGCPPSVDNSPENARIVAGSVLGMIEQHAGFAEAAPTAVEN